MNPLNLPLSLAIYLACSFYSSIMAEKAFTASDALKQLEQQLTCPVCLERYTQPRTLPCLHSFCHQCLSHFPVIVEGGSHCITCPMCSQTNQQPDNGVSGYQPAFIINNLLELYMDYWKRCLGPSRTVKTAGRNRPLGTVNSALCSSALSVSMPTTNGENSAATRYWVWRM